MSKGSSIARKPVLFTDRWLRAVTPAEGKSQQVFTDDHQPGLEVQVGKRAKTFMVRAVIEGRRKRVRLGAYPEMSIAAAREAAAALLEGGGVSAGGPEPNATLELLVSEFLLVKMSGKAAAAAKYSGALLTGRYSLAAFLKARKLWPLAASDLTVNLVREWLAQTHERSPGMVRDYRNHLGAVYRWGLQSEGDYKRDARFRSVSYGLTVNPVEATPPGEVYKPRNTVIPREVVSAVWHHAGDVCAPRMVYALRLLIAMGGLRITEVIHSQKAWWRDGRVYLPAEHVKTGQAHSVPLPSAAQDVLAAALAIGTSRSPYLFPNHRDVSQPVWDASPGKAMKKLCAERGLEVHVPGDLRRTWKTWLLDADLDERDVDIWHNHGRHSDVARKHYDRAQYKDAKARVAAGIDQIMAEIISAGSAAPGQEMSALATRG